MRATDRATRRRLLDQIFVAEERLAPIATGLFASTERPARSAISIAQVQRALRSDELLVEYVLAEPSSVTVTIARTDAHLVKLAARSAVESQIDGFSQRHPEWAGRNNRGEKARCDGDRQNPARQSLLASDRQRQRHASQGAIQAPCSITDRIRSVGHARYLVYPVGIGASRPTQSTTHNDSDIDGPCDRPSPDPAPGASTPPVAIGRVARSVYDVDGEQLRPLPAAGDEARAVLAAFPGRSHSLVARYRAKPSTTCRFSTSVWGHSDI
jgi:hypothetical protein